MAFRLERENNIGIKLFQGKNSLEDDSCYFFSYKHRKFKQPVRMIHGYIIVVGHGSSVVGPFYLVFKPGEVKYAKQGLSV